MVFSLTPLISSSLHLGRSDGEGNLLGVCAEILVLVGELRHGAGKIVPNECDKHFGQEVKRGVAHHTPTLSIGSIK